MLWHIFVPTKGRAGTSQFLNKFGGQLTVTMVVEPQEATTYADRYPGISQFILTDNNRGIAFSRQSILDEARRRGLQWFWMIDDDIGDFGKTVGTKCVSRPPEEILLQAQGVATMPNVRQIALEYKQFAWSAKTDFSFNSYCDVCVAVNTSVDVTYRGEKEDRDFTMQLIHKGWATIRMRTLSFTCPANGSNKGGLHEKYRQSLWEPTAAIALAERWPWCCSVQVKPSGRVDAKINWRAIRNNK